MPICPLVLFLMHLSEQRVKKLNNWNYRQRDFFPAESKSGIAWSKTWQRHNLASPTRQCLSGTSGNRRDLQPKELRSGSEPIWKSLVFRFRDFFKLPNFFIKLLKRHFCKKDHSTSSAKPGMRILLKKFLTKACSDH